jgi:hypothetical protein
VSSPSKSYSLGPRLRSKSPLCFIWIQLTFSAIIVTTSSKKDRLEGYLSVGDIDLTHDDIKAIDHAGAKGELWDERKSLGARVGKAGLLIAAIGYAAFTTAGWIQNCA